jgi:hypothetical protein
MIVRTCLYQDKQEALKALGLEEYVKEKVPPP